MASLPPAAGGAYQPSDDDPVRPPPVPPSRSRSLLSASAALPQATREPLAIVPATHENPSSLTRSSPMPPEASLGVSESFSAVMKCDLALLFLPVPKTFTAIRSDSREMIYTICLHGEITEFKRRTSWRHDMWKLLKPFLSVFLSWATRSSPLKVPRSFSYKLIFSTRDCSRGNASVLQEHKILVNVTSELKSRMSWSYALLGLLQPFFTVMACKIVGPIHHLVSRPTCELICSDVALGTGYINVLGEHLMYADGRYCFVWRMTTDETIASFSVQGLFIPFPPINSSIVTASLSSLVGRLKYFRNGLWCAQACVEETRDWAGLHDNLLQCIFSFTDSFRSLTSASQTCRSWRSVVSTLPRPFLLHPNRTSRTKMMWHIVAPTRVLRNGELQYYRLVTTPVLHTQYKLIGGSDGQLIFFNNCVCYIQSIHTGSMIALPPLPSCCADVYYGVMAPQAKSTESYVILVSDSMLLRVNFDAEGWVMRSLKHIKIGRIVDIVLAGCTAYMMDAEKRLYTLSASLDVAEVVLPGQPRVPNHGVRMGVPIAQFRRQQKAVIERDWLLAWHQKIICIRYVQRKDRMSGFFAFCLVADPFLDDFYNHESARHGVANLKPPCNTWEEMGGLDDCCLFLNLVSGAASFISDDPTRWGLTAGKIYIGDPDTLPWKSFNYGWVHNTSDEIIPLHAEWPSPLFMNSGCSLPEDEAGAGNDCGLKKDDP